MISISSRNTALPLLSLLFLLFVPAAARAAYTPADDIAIDRRGRRVQVDGFLLEWGDGANSWGDSVWFWDAMITAEGVAGYFLSRSASACSVWTFAVEAFNSGRSGGKLSITVPRQRENNIFAFDGGTFESGGVYRVEWLVPWSVFQNGGDIEVIDDYALALSGASECGDTLMSLRLPVIKEKWPPRTALYYVLISIMIGTFATVLAASIALIRKKRRSARGSKRIA